MIPVGKDLAQGEADKPLSKVKVFVAQGVQLCDPMDCSLPGSSVHGVLQAKNTGVGSHSLLQGIFQTQGLILGGLHYVWADSLLSEPPEKPRPLSGHQEFWKVPLYATVITSHHKRLRVPGQTVTGMA